MEDDPFRQSAVVTYYAGFTIPVLLVIVVALANLIFDKTLCREKYLRRFIYH